MNRVTFEVTGQAYPAGSKRPFFLKNRGRLVIRKGNPVYNMTDSSGENGKQWRKKVAVAARAAMLGEGFIGGPLRATFEFYRCRPLNQYGTGKNARHLKPHAPTHPIVAPDVLKLARAAEDAMSKIVYYDDAQIVREVLSKDYVHHWQTPGVRITVERIDEPSDPAQAELFTEPTA